MPVVINWLVLYILLITNLKQCNVYAANILACLPAESYSHHILQTTILEELARRGHNVTVLSTHPPKSVLPTNYHHIHLKLSDVDNWQQFRLNALNNETKTESAGLKRLPKLIHLTSRRSNEILEHEIVKQLMMSSQKFEIFILGYYFNDVLLGLAGNFRIPSVIFSAIPPMKMLRDFVGMPTAASSAPLFSQNGKVDKELSFQQRLGQFLGYVCEYFVVSYINHFVYEKIYYEHFPSNQNYPSFDEVKRNVSLILTNTHLSDGTIRPTMPNVIGIAGVNIKEKPDRLPENIQSILNSSNEHGVIVFSFGGNIKAVDMTTEKLKMFFTVLAELNETIIWKWESDELPADKPNNVHMMKWLPQSDLLAQPQVKLFISHCGTGGVLEAKFHAVPILGMPMMGDQISHGEWIKNENWGIVLDFDSLTEMQLRTSINDILSNVTYKLNAVNVSKLFRDRPMSPLQTAVYWIEYVIRYDGAKHLQSPAVYQNILQRNSLDVIAFIAFVTYVIVKLIAFIVLSILRYRSLIIVSVVVVAYIIYTALFD